MRKVLFVMLLAGCSATSGGAILGPVNRGARGIPRKRLLRSEAFHRRIEAPQVFNKPLDHHSGALWAGRRADALGLSPRRGPARKDGAGVTLGRGAGPFSGCRTRQEGADFPPPRASRGGRAVVAQSAQRCRPPSRAVG
jgi:hypothetical protein